MSSKGNAATRQKELIEKFQASYRPSLSVGCLESVWEYYSRLKSAKRKIIRQYTSQSKGLDFGGFLEKVQKFRGEHGIVDTVGRLILIDKINRELRALPEPERRTYLKGKLLEYR